MTALAVFLVLPLVMFFGTTIAENVTPGRIQCIFSSSAVDRPGEYAFRLEDIPIDYCTHVIYDHISFEQDTMVIMPSNPQYDHFDDGWIKFTDLKKANPKLKLLISYKDIALSVKIATPKARKEFVDMVVWFLSAYKLDGISIFWQGYWSRERGEWGTLHKTLEALHHSFEAAGHPEWEANIMLQIDEAGLERTRLCKEADYVSLIGTLDYMDFTPITSHLFPLHNHGEQQNVSIEYSLQKWLNDGCPASKILLGFPNLARTFTLADATKNEVGAPTIGDGKPCPPSTETGICVYYELCQQFNQTEWTFKWDEATALPYAYKDDQWISYDNAASIERKASFAKSKGLAGVFGLYLTGDDYLGKCGERFPLLKALWKGFQPKPTQ